MAKGRALRDNLPGAYERCRYGEPPHRFNLHKSPSKLQRRAEKRGAPKAAGKTKGGLNTKVHVLTEALGLPLKNHLSPGNDHDSKHALELLSDLSTSESYVIADKAYGSKQIREHIEKQGWHYKIPPKSNAVDPWTYDQWRYRERFQVECFFQKIKWFRRIATRFEKLDEPFKAFIFIASVLIWLK